MVIKILINFLSQQIIHWYHFAYERSENQNPHLHDIVNIICPEFQSSIHNHYKVTELQSFEKLNDTRFLLRNGPYHNVTKIILTEKLFGAGSSNFGFVYLDNIGQHTKTN